MTKPAGTNDARRWMLVVGIVFSLGFAAFPWSRWEHEFAGVGHLIGYEAIWWAAVALVLAYVVWVERQPLRSLGLRSFGIRDALIGFLTGVAILVGLAAIYYKILPWLHLSEGGTMQKLQATPKWWQVISVIRAAVGEEILFRGYALERTEKLTGSAIFAGVFTCTIFALEHVSVWGWGHLLITGFGGGMLTALYLWRRNLWVNMIAHVVVDGVTVLLG